MTISGVEVPPALAALLGGTVDYAGLFPPASLDLRSAADAYAAYRRSGDAWLLGRFVIGADRIAELADAARSHLNGDHWQISLLAGENPSEVGKLLREVERTAGGRMRVEAIELRATSIEEIDHLLASTPATVERYVELPLGDGIESLVVAVGQCGARAKVRTGGVVASAVPQPAALLAFMRACVSHRVPFKATAGLHHPLRERYPLTYAAEAPRGEMFGFLNVFLCAAFLAAGIDDAAALSILDERDPASIRFAHGVRWREHSLTRDQIARGRDALVSFGSCSFREPVDELRALRFLPDAP